MSEQRRKKVSTSVDATVHDAIEREAQVRRTTPAQVARTLIEDAARALVEAAARMG